jgi:hypothetical protein
MTRDRLFRAEMDQKNPSTSGPAGTSSAVSVIDFPVPAFGPDFTPSRDPESEPFCTVETFSLSCLPNCTVCLRYIRETRP